MSDRKYGGLSFSTEDTGQVLAMAGTYNVLHPSALGSIGEFFSMDLFSKHFFSLISKVDFCSIYVCIDTDMDFSFHSLYNWVFNFLPPFHFQALVF